MNAIEKKTKERVYMIDDIYALPDGKRAELIDGQIYNMAPPSYTHQKILGRLHQTIANYLDSCGGKCEIIPAPFAVFLNGDDDKTYLEPDISVICDTSKIDEKGCHGAPDWVIEIVSPSSKPRDYIKKMFLYHMAGVREYWIVDPEEKLITVYRFEADAVKHFSFDDSVPSGIFENFSIDFADKGNI